MKKYFLLGLVLIAGLIMLSSCAQKERVLEGTWTLDSTQVTPGGGPGPRVLGDGSFTLSYNGEIIGIEIYTGSGTIGGFNYVVGASYIEGFGVTISMHEAADDPDVDSIDLSDAAYAGGSSLSGDYAGTAAYGSGMAKDIGAGTFTATK